MDLYWVEHWGERLWLLLLQAGHHLLVALLLLQGGTILAVVSLGHRDLHLKDLVDSDACATLNLLLRPLLVLLPHE